jgi:NAD(P)-dependent dehydrogenase (short-subunit alcohol dehydrogenase family)
MGFHVISACYSSEGAARLKDTVALAVVCDVTKEEDIAALVEESSKLIAAKKLKLWGLVCNAGCVPLCCLCCVVWCCVVWCCVARLRKHRVSL